MSYGIPNNYIGFQKELLFFSLLVNLDCILMIRNIVDSGFSQVDVTLMRETNKIEQHICKLFSTMLYQC